MKKRISATIDDETDRILDKLVRERHYRNKSHAIEDAIRRLAGEKGENKKEHGEIKKEEERKNISYV